MEKASGSFEAGQTLRKDVIAACILLGSLFLIFSHLGRDPLWDDEATTALFAQSVWRTGDTRALLGKNLIAYKSGVELEGLSNRYMPPLQFYLAAPFAGGFPGSASAARLPFAACGLLTVAMLLWWLRRDGASEDTWLLMGVGILGNVSLMLFSRQCRYYAAAMLATIVLAYFYAHRDGRARTPWAMVAASLALLASNYLCYLAGYACLAADYLLWGRKARALTRRELAVLLLPQIVIGGLLLSAYNPVGKSQWGTGNWIQRGWQVYLSFNDFNACEFGSGLLLLLLPFAAFRGRKDLLRYACALSVYILTIGLFAPPRSETGTTVRYQVPLIPLAVFAGVSCIQALTGALTGP